MNKKNAFTLIESLLIGVGFLFALEAILISTTLLATIKLGIAAICSFLFAITFFIMETLPDEKL